MTTRNIPMDQLQSILQRQFKFRHIKNAPNAKGFFVKLERCPLPIYTDNVQYSGADVMAMLGKLSEWRKIIDECEEGLYDFLEREIKHQQDGTSSDDDHDERQPANLTNENRKPEFRHPARGPRTPRPTRDGNR